MDANSAVLRGQARYSSEWREPNRSICTCTVWVGRAVPPWTGQGRLKGNWSTIPADCCPKGRLGPELSYHLDFQKKTYIKIYVINWHVLVFKTKSGTSKTCLKGTCLIYQKRRLLWQQVSKEPGKIWGIKIPARDDISSSEEDKRLGI